MLRAIALLPTVLFACVLVAGCQASPGTGEAALLDRGGMDAHSRAMMDAAAIIRGMERAHTENFAEQRARP